MYFCDFNVTSEFFQLQSSSFNKQQVKDEGNYRLCACVCVHEHVWVLNSSESHMQLSVVTTALFYRGEIIHLF